MRIVLFLSILSVYLFAVELFDKNKVISQLQTEYFVDKNSQLDINGVLGKKSEFIAVNQERIDADYKDAVWFRFVFSSKISGISRWMLYHSIVPMDKLEFYSIHSSGEIQKFVSGDLVKFSEKQVPSRYQTMFFELEQNETIEVFVRTQNQGRITSDFVLSPAAMFIAKNSEENLIWGIYFGFFVAMIFYNFWLFVTMRDKLYGVYVVNIGSMFAMMLIVYGFVQPLLSANMIEYVDISSRFLGVFAPSMFILFLMFFFDTKKKFLKIHILLKAFFWLIMAVCVMFIVDIFRCQIYKWQTGVTFVMVLLYIALLLFVSIFMVYKKERWAWYILSVSIINVVWIGLLSFSFTGIIDENGIVEKVGIVKNLFHIAVLSIVLGLRFSWLRKEKEVTEMLFAQQSKRAVAGDMVANITHQWKQPITELESVLSAMRADLKLGKIDALNLQNDCKNASDIVQKMAFSVDFFQDFFRLKTKVDKIDILDVINTAIEAFSHTFEKSNIKISVQKSNDSIIFADRNGLLQVFSIIFQNAKEAFEERVVQEPQIQIKIHFEKSFIVVDVADNAGGCDESIINKIFEPFFGTKQSSTGSGLYLAKIIIEQQMSGFISAKNSDTGLVLSVGLPDYFLANL